MSYCSNCGTQLNPAGNCPECFKTRNIAATTPVNDRGGFGWNLLGFCIPIVGLILYLVWKDTQPLNAKAVGVGALVSVGLSVFFYVILIAAAAASF
jgi:hypothetical protein